MAASNLAARTLCDLLLGRDTPLSRLPWVNTRPRAWEPEPLRYAGARGIYALYRKADHQEELSRPAGAAGRPGGPDRRPLSRRRVAGRHSRP